MTSCPRLAPPGARPSAPTPQTSIPPPLPPDSLDSTFPPAPSRLQALLPPPAPLPPPPLVCGPAPPHVFGMAKSQLLKEALQKAGPVPTGREDVRRLLKLFKERCGLVALWMAGTLLDPSSSIPLERLVQVAVERGYTIQGEMFSVANMGRLAQEALGCQAELLCGGLGGPNRDRVLQHLIAGYPLLIPYPGAGAGARAGYGARGSLDLTIDNSFHLNTSTSYDEDFNHEPCQRKGHKAHWAVSAGVLLGVPDVPSCGYAEDPELAGLFHPVPSTAWQPPPLPEEGCRGAVHLLSKQGKSWHYQLWDYDQVCESNLQLTDFSPSRAADGRSYVVPAGGLRAGLCGQALLLSLPLASH